MIDTDTHSTDHDGYRIVVDPNDYASRDGCDPAGDGLQQIEQQVRKELSLVRERLVNIHRDLKMIASARLEWGHASARLQREDYPWIKVGGAMAGTFLLTRILKAPPMTGLLRTVGPLVLPFVQAKMRGSRGHK
jgi:hypothetical protein